MRRVALDISPLRYPDFRRLWVGQGVSFLGFQVTAVAVPIQIFGLTHSSLWVGLLGLASLLPLVVFGLWGGAVADIMDRRRLVLVASSTTWLATWGLVAQAVLHSRSPVLLLALTAVQSAGFAISGPTRGAIIPRLVPVDLVPAANTANFLVQSVGAIAGPLVGALVVAHAGFADAYAIDAALFTVGLYASVRLPSIAPGEATNHTLDVASATGVLDPATVVPLPTGAGFRSIAEGIGFVIRRPVLLMSFVVDIIAMSFAMPRALFPQVSHERFGGSVGAVGWLYAAIAVGAVMGGLLSGWVGRVRRQGLALLIAIAGWGVFVALAGISHLLWLTVALLAIAGACDLVGTVYRQTILQTYAHDAMRGRLQGIFTVVVVGGPRLGDLRAGVMAAATSTTVSWVAGGLACVVAIVAIALLVPSFTRYVPAGR